MHVPDDLLTGIDAVSGFSTGVPVASASSEVVLALVSLTSADLSCIEMALQKTDFACIVQLSLTKWYNLLPFFCFHGIGLRFKPWVKFSQCSCISQEYLVTWRYIT